MDGWCVCASAATLLYGRTMDTVLSLPTPGKNQKQCVTSDDTGVVEIYVYTTITHRPRQSPSNDATATTTSKQAQKLIERRPSPINGAATCVRVRDVAKPQTNGQTLKHTKQKELQRNVHDRIIGNSAGTKLSPQYSPRYVS